MCGVVLVASKRHVYKVVLIAKPWIQWIDSDHKCLLVRKEAEKSICGPVS